MEFKFDPQYSYTAGYYICSICESKFHTYNDPKHSIECSSGLDKLVYFYGFKEALLVLKKGNSVYSFLRREHVETNPEVMKDKRVGKD